MSYWQIVGTVIVAVSSFFVGWLTATEKVRMEVYKARLDAYRSISRKAAKVLMLSLPRSDQIEKAVAAKKKLELYTANLELVEEVMASGALISRSVLKHYVKMTHASDKEDSKEIWDAYLVLSHWMAADLGLFESFSINETLMNPVKRVLKHLRRKGSTTFPSGHKYVGEFKDNLRDGQGTMTFPSGHKYIGEFKDDQRDGQGVMTFPDNRKYVGEWKGNVRNGQGTLYGADGTILRSGIWENDVFVESP